MTIEITSALIGLGGVVVGSFISSMTTLLIHRSERQKYRRERSWDHRREAYTNIIGALDRARAIGKHIDEKYQEDPHSWGASESNRTANDQMIDFFHSARNAFHANRLMLSSAFVAKYDKMNWELGEADWQNLTPPETSEIAKNVMCRIVPEMEALAIRELGVEF